MSSNKARELPEPDRVTAELIAIYQIPEFSAINQSFPLGVSESAREILFDKMDSFVKERKCNGGKWIEMAGMF